MMKAVMRVMGGLVILLAGGSAYAEESGGFREEIDALKSKLECLEKAAEQQTAPAEIIDDEKQWYKRIGFAVGATGVLQGSSGVRDWMNPDGNVTDGSMSLDMELTLPMAKHSKFYSLFEAGAGDGIDGNIPTLSGFNDDADDDQSLRLTEIWYEQLLFGEHVRLRGGKIDLTRDFDTSAVANSETDQFLSSGFVNNLAVEFPDDNGFGAMLWVSPGALLDIGFGFADADADWNEVFGNVFSIAELDFKPKIAGRPGNHRLYGWFNGKNHERVKGPDKAKEENYGFGLSMDQEIAAEVVLFARYGWQRGSVSRVEHAWSSGFRFSGKLFGRSEDCIGLAYGRAIIGNDWKDVDLANGVHSGDEHHLELFYNIKVNGHLNIAPDIQWARNPNGDKRNNDTWVFGMRAQLSF